jgi:formate dehydrogenase major subunit
MTNTWADTNVAVTMDGNPAEAHPCGFKWVTEAKAHNKARLIVVDPRFTRSAAIADLYVPIALAAISPGSAGRSTICSPTTRSPTNISRSAPSFGFSGGRFTSYNEQKRDCDRSSWGYEIGEDGCAKVDETLLDPRCVFQLMKAHHACYTPEMSPKDKLLQAWQWIAETSAPDQAMTSMYALGWTQHSEASQNLRAMAMVQLLLGNMSLGGHLPGRKMAACLGGHPR